MGSYYGVLKITSEPTIKVYSNTEIFTYPEIMIGDKKLKKVIVVGQLANEEFQRCNSGGEREYSFKESTRLLYMAPLFFIAPIILIGTSSGGWVGLFGALGLVFFYLFAPKYNLQWIRAGANVYRVIQ